MGHFSAITQNSHFIKRYCNDLDIKLVVSSSGGPHSRVVYQFACAVRAVNVSETVRHFSMRVKEQEAIRIQRE